MSYAERFFNTDGTFRSPELAAEHAIIVQGGFSTPRVEAERMVKDGGLGAIAAHVWLDDHANERATCEWCGGDAIIGTTCPKSIECPTCGRGPGQRCRRPSGHVADTLHATRVAAAELLDANPSSGGRASGVPRGY